MGHPAGRVANGFGVYPHPDLRAIRPQDAHFKITDGPASPDGNHGGKLGVGNAFAAHGEPAPPGIGGGGAEHHLARQPEQFLPRRIALDGAPVRPLQQQTLGGGRQDGVVALEGDEALRFTGPGPGLDLMLVPRDLNGRPQLPLRKRLDDVAEGLGKLRLRQDVIVSECRQENDRQVALHANGLGGGDAVHGAGELDIHQHEVRPEFPSEGDGLLPS